MIRFLLSALLMAAGLFFECSAVFGVWRFKYVLNRMHAAALGDTMGMFLILLGLCTANGMNMLSVKLLLLAFLFWLASPISTHMLARLEMETNEHVMREVTEWKR